jgi:hypothetical protein
LTIALWPLDPTMDQAPFLTVRSRQYMKRTIGN